MIGFNPEANMRLLEPSCNLQTIGDGRGGIFTWANQQPIVEFNLIYTKAGENRGYHYHTEFTEYVLVVSGEGVYTQWVRKDAQQDRLADGDSQYPFIKMGPGMVIEFPIGCPHTFHAITDVRMIAMLTKKWDDCEHPITRVEE